MYFYKIRQLGNFARSYRKVTGNFVKGSLEGLANLEMFYSENKMRVKAQVVYQNG